MDHKIVSRKYLGANVRPDGMAELFYAVVRDYNGKEWGFVEVEVFAPTGETKALSPMAVDSAEQFARIQASRERYFKGAHLDSVPAMMQVLEDAPKVPGMVAPPEDGEPTESPVDALVRMLQHVHVEPTDSAAVIADALREQAFGPASWPTEAIKEAWAQRDRWNARREATDTEE